MRPSPAELISAVRDTLREVGAELKSPQAESALRRVMYVLREGRWNDAVFDLIHENEVLRVAIGQVAAYRSRSEDAVVPDRQAGIPGSYAQVHARNAELRRRLAEVIENLADGDLPASARLREELARVLLGRFC